MRKRYKNAKEYIAEFGEGDWIYPSIMCRAMRFSDVGQAYMALNALCEESIVTQYISINCPVCGRVYGQYKEVTDIPCRITCPTCHERLRVEHGAIIYRKK